MKGVAGSGGWGLGAVVSRKALTKVRGLPNALVGGEGGKVARVPFWTHSECWGAGTGLCMRWWKREWQSLCGGGAGDTLGVR